MDPAAASARLASERRGDDGGEGRAVAGIHSVMPMKVGTHDSFSELNSAYRSPRAGIRQA